MKAMYTSKCTRKGCEREFKANSVGQPFKSQAQADQALKMHVGRSHTKSIISGNSGRRGPRETTLVVAGNGHHTHNGNGNGNGGGQVLVVSEPRTDKRTRAWREANAATAKPIGGKRKYTRRAHKHEHTHPALADDGQTINNCWNCGATQKHLAQALVLAKLIESDPKIRQKVQAILEKV